MECGFSVFTAIRTKCKGVTVCRFFSERSGESPVSGGGSGGGGARARASGRAPDRDSSPHRTSRSGDNAIHGLPPFLRLHYPLPYLSFSIRPYSHAPPHACFQPPPRSGCCKRRGGCACAPISGDALLFRRGAYYYLYIYILFIIIILLFIISI